MNISIHNPPAALMAACWSAARRRYCLIRYGRMDALRGVLIAGRIKPVGGTRLALRAHSVTRQTLQADGGGLVATGERTRVRGGCWIGAHELIAISDWFMISDCCAFDHDYRNAVPRTRHLPRGAAEPVHLGRNVWIAIRASVTKGLQIGADSVIGAGSVVPGTVPAGVVVIGDLAKVVRTFNNAARTFPQPGPSGGPAGSILIPQTLGRPQ